MFSTDFHEVPNQTSGKSIQWETPWYIWTGSWDMGMTKLTGASRIYANSPTTAVRNCVKRMTVSWREQFRTAVLCELAKLWKATISFVMYVCLSVRPHGTTRLQLGGFSWNL